MTLTEFLEHMDHGGFGVRIEVHATIRIIGPKGELPLRFARRIAAELPVRVALPHVGDDEQLLPDQAIYVLSRLGISEADFGYDLTPERSDVH